MTQTYRHIRFIEQKERWICQSIRGDTILGTVAFHSRYYVFKPNPKISFGHDCLLDIADFLSIQNQNRRNGDDPTRV
ncbi:MAG: hypothetical protein UV58_C0026G0007 [Candidatus Wolfebacteria bacterium GW2011_GWC1_43_10]|uniref:Uncharacterized protein n=1 Tax=Candidatus Wolfebacteria bacterium GW2011_GWC1_43_10 TaxID=1619011 RepID=A0A0G1C6L4_9BACT|nr:MAG: hypothetical protein UV58_C0026G0007 [Candidatus Wolfebacteria bacterium GW2011_GWC1_43_10]